LNKLELPLLSRDDLCHDVKLGPLWPSDSGQKVGKDRQIDGQTTSDKKRSLDQQKTKYEPHVSTMIRCIRYFITCKY
jgi:hypothetical protein